MRLPRPPVELFTVAVPAATVTVPRREFNRRGNPAVDPEEAQLVQAVSAELTGIGVPEEIIHIGTRYPQRRWSTAGQRRGGFDLALAETAQDDARVVAEFKLWDIEQTLFDLAKVCTALEDEEDAAFLIVWAPDTHWESTLGRELYPDVVGERREFDFEDLVTTHAEAWAHDIRLATPMPTSIPCGVATSAIVDAIASPAYPETSVRAVSVEVLDATPIILSDGHLRN